MRYWTKHFLKPLFYAVGDIMVIALSLFKVSHPWFTMIWFSSSPSLHTSYTATYLQPFHHCPLAVTCPGSYWPLRWMLVLAPCSPPPLGFPADSQWKTPLSPPLKTSHELCPLFNTERRPLALVLEDQRYSSECVIAVCHILRRFFLKLFWLFISHVLTSFACIHLFPLLNGSWCFTWRKAFFCESCRAFKTQFACEKSWS